MADLALGVVKDIVKTGMAIKEAVDTVRQNEEECQELRVRVATIIHILSWLQKMELTRHPAMFGALMGLNGSLDRALKLVTECQKRKAMHRLLTAGDMAKQLRRVQNDIQLNMTVGNLAINVSIMEFTFEYTRTAVRLGGAQPQQAAAEMEIYGSHSTTGGAARSVVYSDKITTMVTTGAVASSASSSSEIESSVAIISEENIHWVYYRGSLKQKIVFKMQMTSDKCRGKAMALVARANGVESVTIAPDGKDQVVIVGYGVDFVHLLRKLRKKVAPTCMELVSPAKQNDEYMTKRVVFKVRMTSDKCRAKAMALMSGAGGVHSVAIAGDREDQVVVVADVDVVDLAQMLRKVGLTDVVSIGLVKQKDEYMTRVVTAEEAQQEPATRWPRTRISGGIRDITAKLSRFMRPRPRSSTTCQAAPSSSLLLIEHTDSPAPAPTTGPWPHLFPGESSSSMTFSAATPPAGIHQYQEHDLLLQHQPVAPPATAPVRHRRRAFNTSKIHRSGRLTAVRQSRMMPRAKRIEAPSFERSGARVLLPLMSCALCTLVLLASVWALR